MFARALGQGRLGWLAGLAVLAIASHALGAFMGLLGLLLDGVLWMVGMKVAVEAMLRAVSGADDPDRHEDVDDGLALRHFLLWLLLGGVGALCWRLAGGASFALYALAVLAVLPGVLALLTLERSLLRAFDPRGWAELLARAGATYFAIAGILAGVLVGALALQWALASVLEGWLLAAPLRFVQLAALVVGYHALGEWLHARREAFALATHVPLPRAKLASFDEDAAMHEAGQLAADDPAAAAARLLPVLRGRGGSAPVHARYRELLQAAGDTPALLAHDREYIATLLALGQDRAALSLFLAARALDPGFELDEPVELGQLILLTERIGQPQLAVTLAAEYERRFPRTRDAVAHGLRAAQLLATRLDRVGEARALLQSLLAREPEHALRPQLEQALQALPSN